MEPTKSLVRLPIANNALLEAPKFETHKRGKNWMAVIDIDATAPVGLGRDFLPRGRGECLYIVEKVDVFDPIEFGADYMSGTGRKYTSRWYGIVVAKTDGVLLIEECETGAKAVLRAREARISTTDRIRALQVERDEIIDRAAKIEIEIQDLQREALQPAPPSVATNAGS